MELTEAILFTITTAATPLLLAALGELVVERSGVLNLGVEGMIVMGAVPGVRCDAALRFSLYRCPVRDDCRMRHGPVVRLHDAHPGDQPGRDGASP